LPELFGADDRDFGEVVRANEERIVVEDLRSGRFVVGVVETDEGVAEEGRELAPGGFELGFVSGCFDDLGEVGLYLQLGVMGGVDPGCPVDFLTLGEDGTGHLELAELSGEGEHSATGGLSLLHVTQAIAESEEGVERDEVLIHQHGTNSSGQFLTDSLAVGCVLGRACEKIDDGAG
jgi:hypothetical protein